MSANKGRFAWYELMSPDPAAAKAFYGAVVGWSAEAIGPTEAPYHRWMVGDVGAGGLLTLTAEMQAGGARPAWIGYIAVDDVDAAAKAVTAAGGAIHKAPEDIPGVGRFAMAADPHGAPFVLFKPSVDGTPLPLNPTESGLFAWRELLAGDLESAFAFYSDLFGWAKGEAFDMGPMGIYQLFSDEPQGEAIGGMMTKPAQAATPFWIYYIQVDSVAEAVARAKTAGGELLSGPHQVPGGNWVAQGRDAEGALFALTSLKA